MSNERHSTTSGWRASEALLIGRSLRLCRKGTVCSLATFEPGKQARLNVVVVIVGVVVVVDVVVVTSNVTRTDWQLEPAVGIKVDATRWANIVARAAYLLANQPLVGGVYGGGGERQRGKERMVKALILPLDTDTR